MKHPFAVGTLSYALMAFVAVLLDISLFFCKEGRILNYPSVMPDALPIDIEGISTVRDMFVRVSMWKRDNEWGARRTKVAF